MAWRNLAGSRTRTVLSVLAVAADVTGEAIRSAGQAIEGSQGTVAFVGNFLNSGLSIMGLVILAAAGFLIFNAFSMAVTRRRRQIGALRALGMTRRQVMRQVMIEAFIIGGLGTLLGVIGGPLLGRGILAGMRAAGYEVGTGHVVLSSVALEVGMGLGVTLLSVLILARCASLDDM